MKTKRRFVGLLALVVLATTTSYAQQEPPSGRPATGATVTAATSAGRVRFAAPGNVLETRLEIFSQAGEKLVDSGFQRGNIIDWSVVGQQQELGLPDGSYVCVVTVRSLTGRLTQRYGQLELREQRAELQTADATTLTPSQERALAHGRESLGLDPVVGDQSLTILSADSTAALTLLAHDGQDGQLTSTAGALSLRTGDLFSGKDVERVRITEAGRVGIGTDKPEATLDVAGMIRAREGLMFSDGSTLQVNEKGVLTRTSADGSSPSSVSSTQNRIAKFTDGIGTLGDSLLGETAGGVELRPAVAGIGVNPTLTNFSTVAGFSQMSFYPAAGPNTNMSFTVVPRGTGAANNRAQFSVFNTDLGASPTNYEFAALRARGSDFVLGTGKSGTGVNRPFMFASGYLSDNTTNNGQFYLASNGNVGVGTTNPAAKLDVAGNINTATQFNIDGQRVLGLGAAGGIFVGPAAGSSNTGSFNSFVGNFAGALNTSGDSNSFFGSNTGFSNTTGQGNAFFGTNAGLLNTTAGDNSFFGTHAGGSNTTGTGNSYFGSRSGRGNTTGNSNSFFGTNAGSQTNGDENSFFGKNAGSLNTTGFHNSFFGFEAGRDNETGTSNSFFGYQAGSSNTTGNANSFFGVLAGFANTTAGGNSFFGGAAGWFNTTGEGNAFFGGSTGEDNTTGSHNSFFGKDAGRDNTTGESNSFFGYQAGFDNKTGVNNAFFGRDAGDSNTTGSDNSLFGTSAGSGLETGTRNTFVGYNSGGGNITGSNNTFIGAEAGLSTSFDPDYATAIGAGAKVTTSNTLILGRPAGEDTVIVPGKLEIGTLAAAGSTQLCLNAFNRVGTCSSSLRYKTNMQPFAGGLDLINRLRPISFTWKDGGMHDLGLGAEEVAAVDPLLVTYNAKGEVEGVKYDRIGVVLINATLQQQEQIKQQQAQLERQRLELEHQQNQIEGLKRLVCLAHPDAAVCW